MADAHSQCSWIADQFCEPGLLSPTVIQCAAQLLPCGFWVALAWVWGAAWLLEIKASLVCQGEDWVIFCHVTHLPKALHSCVVERLPISCSLEHECLGLEGSWAIGSRISAVFCLLPVSEAPEGSVWAESSSFP